MLKVVSTKQETAKEIESSLDAIVREGAKRMLSQALQLEVDEYIQRTVP